MLKRLKSNLIVFGLCIALLFGASASIVDFGAANAGPSSLASATDLEDVTGKYSLESIRQSQYASSVEEKPEELEGSGSVIIKIKGDSLFDHYSAKSVDEEFSDYVITSEADRLESALVSKQNKVLRAMTQRGIEYKVKHTYTALTNAVSVEVDYKDMAKIEKISGVESVYYSNHYAVPEVFVSTNNANVYSTGIYNTDGVGYDGSGMVVAVLDTGLDYTHAAFQHMPATKAWNEDYVSARLGNTMAKTSKMPSLTTSDVYVNDKVPYAFDYADDDANVYPAYSAHGTHVAGIIAGKDNDKTVGESKPGEKDEKFIGVAPEAQLVIMKVFTDDLDSEMLGGADTDDILAAINDCAVLGVDVINMSLGSSGGFTSELTNEFLSNVYGDVERLGISLVVAAGNESSSGSGGGNGMNLASNPDSGTVGSPSTYGPALSVASINGKESPYFIANGEKETAAFVTNAADINSNDIEFVDLLLEDDAFKDKVDSDGNLTLQYVVVGGVGRSANYTATVKQALRREPSVALVRRGDISFSEKVQNAKSAGAKGVIIYNNLSGEIKMSLADLEDPLPACSISLNAGTAMVSNAVRSVGTITLNKTYTAGPFMSSFSGLGVTPDLKLKPEITAHGGEILSAVPGGYDTFSGTSMASPNMAGAVALLRQYLTAHTSLSGKALNARVNQILMSTATIALNPDGNPYSPRKQGAGLANIKAAVHTSAYLTVPGEDGAVKDKTKLEFGDDVEKDGVYGGTFTAVNESNTPKSYKLSSYVFTETLAINKRTVEETAYMLDDAVVSYQIGGTDYVDGDTVTLPANSETDITASVMLSSADKKYLDESFENGMYVEGYFRLVNVDGSKAETELGLPFLAFYGDWSAAPLFDYSMYELAVTDADNSIPDEDKPKASARETTPLGLYDDGKYIMPLGSYMYNQDENNIEIFPDSDKAAVSMYDDDNRKTIYQLYMIYGGLLRGAKELQITITDAVTGETVYDKTEYNVRKSYANGGSNVGSPIMVEMNPFEWGLSNNREYIFKMKGKLDWEKNGGKVDNDTFEFNFHVDYEAPSIESYSVRFEPYTDNKETKYRIYLDVNVYDNQYVQDLLPCYVKDNTLYLMTEYAIPVYSEQNSITKVSFEITDYYDEYHDSIYLGVEDYAMNQSLYRLNLKNATTYCEKLDFEQQEDKFTLTKTETQTMTVDGKEVRNEYGVYDLTLAPNEAYELKPTATPDNTYSYKLDWLTNKASVATAYENEIFAKAEGKAIVTVRDNNGFIKARINVTVAGEAQKVPQPEKISFRPVVNKDNNIQSIAGEGSVLELYPYTKLELKLDYEPWFLAGALKVDWESSNPEILTVDEKGVVNTLKKGTAYVTASVEGYRVRASVQIKVVSEYRIVNYTLFEYHGSPVVDIPDELNIMYLDEDCFQGNREITAVTLPKTLTEIPKEAFKNCTKLETLTLKSQTNIVGESAFEGCVSLKTLNLLEFEDEDFGEPMTGALTVGNRAFAGCISLTTIKNPTRLTTVGREAFKGCTSLKELDLSGLALVYDNAFENCTGLKNLTLSGFTGMANNMFKGCTSLESVTYPMTSVYDGMFENCTKLRTVDFTSPTGISYIGSRAFKNTAITNFSLPKGDVRVGSYAFAGNKALSSFDIGADAKITFVGIGPFEGCSDFTAFTVNAVNANYSVDGGVLYNKNKTQILLVPEAVTSVTPAPSVTRIGNNVFAGKTSITAFNFSNITSIGDYAFAGSGLISVTLPASVAEIGVGAFENCAKLSAVNIQNSTVTVIKSDTFKGCASLASVTLPSSVTAIESGAFQNSLVSSVSFANVKSIGDNAFRASRLTSVELPAAVAEIGAYAFAECRALTAVNALGAVTKMGEGAFMDCPKLASASFGDGTTVIGNMAFFWSDLESTSPLSKLELPETVETIGEGAFFNCGNLRYADLKNVKTIGNIAFMGAGINSINTKATSIGALAFAAAGNLHTAYIDSAATVGVRAFYGAVKLATLSMNSVKTIGANAFTGTSLLTVNIPATLANYSYDNTFKYHSDSSGKYEEVTIKSESIGYGAFAGMDYLTAINVDANNPTFFSKDGVLYARVQNGYSLVQYPAAYRGNERTYTVLDGTVRIEADAFNGTFGLDKVIIPSDVKNIGARAFYNSSVKDYTFKSVEAPVLDSEYVDYTSLNEKDILYTIFATTGNLNLGSQVFYANFYDYVAKRTEEKKLNDSGNRYTAPSFGLKITYPVNGSGYDNLIWTAFFEQRETSEYAADSLTISTNRAIAALPTKATIDAADINELNRISSELVAKARTLYNSIAIAGQLELVEGFDKLVEAERNVRARRAALGAAATITEVKIASKPDKLRYFVGEKLDTTGMKVIAVYSDSSEEIITDYTLDKTGELQTTDKSVTVTYNGISVSFDISVQVKVVWKVTFSGEGVSEFTVETINNQSVARPEDPSRKGWRFLGWYIGDVEYNFDNVVNKDLTLTAKWEQTGEEPSGGCNGSVGMGGALAGVLTVLSAAAVILYIRKSKRHDRASR